MNSKELLHLRMELDYKWAWRKLLGCISIDVGVVWVCTFVIILQALLQKFFIFARELHINFLKKSSSSHKYLTVMLSPILCLLVPQPINNFWKSSCSLHLHCCLVYSSYYFLSYGLLKYLLLKTIICKLSELFF